MSGGACGAARRRLAGPRGTSVVRGGGVARPLPDPQRVDGAGAAPDLTQPVAHRLACDALRRARRRERREAEGEVCRERRGVGAAGAMRRAVGVALPRDLDQLLTVEEEIERLVAMAPGDHDAPGA